MKANIKTKIITDIDAFNERVSEITSGNSYESIKDCAAKMKKVLYDNPEFAAICAPQIGKDLRMFIVRTARSESERFKVFLNPMIINSEGVHMSREANLSFPGKEFIIPRKNKLHLAYQEIDGRVNSETYSGAYAEVIQQMVEMLDGITLADYGLDLEDVGGPAAFDKSTKKAKVELLSIYIETLKSYSDDLAEEIKNTPELKYLDDLIKFNTGVATGEIELIKAEDSNKENSGDAI